MLQDFLEYMNNNIIGQDELKLSMLIAIIGKGHLLIEGNPGLAKTKSIKLLADFFEGDFSRIQGTPDLLPVDILGARAFDAEQRKYIDFAGPIFSNIVLVDEINRAPAKLQSAFFEAMAEGQVTVSGDKKMLPDFFHIFATMNTLSSLGTFELPEAQKDRFFLSCFVSYPTQSEEKKILLNADRYHPPSKKYTYEDIMQCREELEQIYISDTIYDSICELIAKSRDSQYAKYFDFPYSVRATQDVLLAAKIFAYLKNAESLLPEHVIEVAPLVLRHRTALSYIGMKDYESKNELIKNILDNTKWLYEESK